ncbi:MULTISPECIES: ATP-dependent nuclease [Micrococcus]|uniref:ATP-dependent nuclease n=1 Tax=Micrococcus TaxID=1269 RepID=UPI0024AF2C59|nr:AAA family ATPase [Micrococcus yunnanensis]WHM15856.1 AAA family ATPase [Micrococcus yunnanensis]
MSIDPPSPGASTDAELEGDGVKLMSGGPEVLGQRRSPLIINSVRIRNFKRIADTRIELGPITYLVGGNNSGKSSVLQAIHTAVSCAQASVELGQQVIAEASLRYSPVAEFSLLGHGAQYSNRGDGLRGSVLFEGVPADSDLASEFRIEMYKARNHNNVGVDRSGTSPGFGQVISDPKKLFSVYVPGLAGVPHREEMSGYAAVFRKAASGDANLVFRNIIRLLSERNELRDLETLLESVLKTPVSFLVRYDPDRDLYVDVRLATGESTTAKDHLPVDLWGTGILQITQIFAYVLLFKPALLLVDEPDSHLHPSRQKALGVALEKIATVKKCKVIVSTHSRHLITGASDAVKVVWMKDGDVETDDRRDLTALLMDLGALDQLDLRSQVIICTEDEDPWALRLALRESGFHDEKVKIASFNGLGNKYTAEAFREMSDMMVSSPRVIVHRDRDFLTDDELEEWSRVFIERGIEVFCPKMCDTEAYHATVEHIAKVTNLDVETATQVRSDVVAEWLPQLRAKHREKRRAINRVHLDGGTPRTDELWPESAGPTDDVLYGKLLLTQVEKRLKELRYLDKTESLQDEASASLSRELKAFLDSDDGVEFSSEFTSGAEK